MRMGRSGYRKARQKDKDLCAVSLLANKQGQVCVHLPRPGERREFGAVKSFRVLTLVTYWLMIPLLGFLGFELEMAAQWLAPLQAPGMMKGKHLLLNITT